MKTATPVITFVSIVIIASGVWMSCKASDLFRGENSVQQWSSFYHERGNDRADKNDVKGALADYDKCIALDPDYFGAYFDRGMLRSQLGDKQGAKADFDIAIKLNPNFADAYAARAKECDNDDDDLALADYERALELDPNCIQALYGRSHVRFRFGDKQGAIADLKALINLNPSFKDDMVKLLHNVEALQDKSSLPTHESESKHVPCGTSSDLAAFTA